MNERNNIKFWQISLFEINVKLLLSDFNLTFSFSSFSSSFSKKFSDRKAFSAFYFQNLFINVLKILIFINRVKNRDVWQNVYVTIASFITLKYFFKFAPHFESIK